MFSKTSRKAPLIFLAFLLVFTIVFSSACSSSEQNENEASTFPAREKRIQNDELIVAIGAEPEAGFDATTSGHGSLTKLLFSSLFQRDKALGWEGDLATNYSVSDDGLVWTVTLRDDAQFSDGQPVTAEDVVYTYETTKKAASETDLTMLESAVAKDSTTVVFTLTRPFSPFIERLAYLGIVPKHAHGIAFKDNPIGSGPYTLVQWDKGQQIILNANESYYGEVPKIKRLTLAFLEQDTAVSALERGDIDVAQVSGNLASRQVPGAAIVDIESIECYGVCFPSIPSTGQKSAKGYPVGNDVTSDVAIRKALNTVLDREKIVSSILRGYGSVSTTGLEQMPWLNQSVLLAPSEYNNPEAAKQILSSSKWIDSDGDGIVEKEGKRAEFKLLYTPGVYRQEFALEFQTAAKSIGIDVTLEQTTWDTIEPKIHTSAVLFGFGSGDPSELYNLYYGGNLGTGVPWDNAGYYSNKKVDTEINAALSAKTEEEAIPHWKALQEYASAKGDAPYAWLANANHVYFVAEGFSFGEPVVQPHGGRIFDNAIEWTWE